MFKITTEEGVNQVLNAINSYCLESEVSISDRFKTLPEALLNSCIDIIINENENKIVVHPLDESKPDINEFFNNVYKVIDDTIDIKLKQLGDDVEGYSFGLDSIGNLRMFVITGETRKSIILSFNEEHIKLWIDNSRYKDLYVQTEQGYFHLLQHRKR